MPNRRAAISNGETPDMPSTSDTAVKNVLAELESLGDEKRRQFNAKVGRDGIAGVPLDKQFGCKTGDVRKVAKKLKTNHELGQKLWKTGNMDAQMLAILIMKPKGLSAKELDTMVRETRFSWGDGLAAVVHHQAPARRREREAAQEVDEEERKRQLGLPGRLASRRIDDQQRAGCW